jgi:hypothetical protein
VVKLSPYGPSSLWYGMSLERLYLYINERREVSTLQLSVPASGHLVDDLHLHLRSRSCSTTR